MVKSGINFGETFSANPTYIATIHKDEDSDYGVQFYDFPGCISAGESIEEVKIMAKEALIGHINLMVEDGDFIPKPSTSRGDKPVKTLIERGFQPWRSLYKLSKTRGLIENKQ